MPKGIFVRTKKTLKNMSLAQIGKHHSEERKKRISESMKGVGKGRHFSKETRMKISKGNKGKFVSEETKKKMSKASSGRKHSAETIEKIRKSHIGKYHSKETIKKIGESKKKAAEERGYYHSEETRRKIGLASRGHPCSELTKEKIKKSNEGKTWKELFGIKGARKLRRNLSQSIKKLWQNPKYVTIQMKARGIIPNKVEKRLGELLKNLFSTEYKYVGNGQFIIGGRCPDFINVNGQKKIIEMFGNYWHSEKLQGRTKRQEENQKINHFAKYGYKTLIVWECELKNAKKLERKILQFHIK